MNLVLAALNAGAAILVGAGYAGPRIGQFCAKQTEVMTPQRSVTCDMSPMLGGVFAGEMKHHVPVLLDVSVGVKACEL